MSIDEIKNMNIKEKLILINTILESLDNDSDKVESPLWHKTVLEKRLSKIVKGKATYLSLEELRKR